MLIAAAKGDFDVLQEQCLNDAESCGNTPSTSDDEADEEDEPSPEEYGPLTNEPFPYIEHNIKIGGEVNRAGLAKANLEGEQISHSGYEGL